MALPLSSSLRFRSRSGALLAAPLEWQPCYAELHPIPSNWTAWSLTLQGAPLELFQMRLGGTLRLLAELPRCGPGSFRLRMASSEGGEERTFTVEPRKLTVEAYAALLEDLESRLPVTIAMAFQRLGGLTGLKLAEPGANSVEQELVRLRQAILGAPGGLGLVAILTELARGPHEAMRAIAPWVPRERARRPIASQLSQALTRQANMSSGLPIHVIDARVEPTVDTYENRLLRTFYEAVYQRLCRLQALLSVKPDVRLAELVTLRGALAQARRQAAFLDHVSLLTTHPDQVTLVTLKVPPYRAALSAWRAFRQSLRVEFQDAGLATPLDELPRIYQRWGTLLAIEALLDVAGDKGYRVVGHQLWHRGATGLELRILPDGRPAVELEHPVTMTRVRLIPEARYGAAGPVYSVSFTQKPDVAIEVEPLEGPVRLLILDPKYKLRRDEAGEPLPDGPPVKEDIDKMHAYRDALRGRRGEAVVSYAAILYPGATQHYGESLEAIRAHPAERERLSAHLRGVLMGAI